MLLMRHDVNAHLRIAGHHPTALETLADALDENKLPIDGDLSGIDIHAPDPYQIDLSLQVDLNLDVACQEPQIGTSYSGLTPLQRGFFTSEADSASNMAWPAFQRLIMTHFEVNLLDIDIDNRYLYRDLIRWSDTAAWLNSKWMNRVLLLALWLTQNGKGIAEWTFVTELPPEIAEIAIGMQTLLGEPLRPEQLGRMALVWDVPGAQSTPDVLSLRLNTLEESLGVAPLAHIREQLSDTDMAPRPWRTAHRALRFSVPQPVIRPILEPLLWDTLGITSEDVADSVNDRLSRTGESASDWRLILEFGQSRSEFYHHVLDLAQHMPGYMQIMDEDRRIVHRVLVRKREMRRFWRMWEYVQNWSTTHVYMNGEELEKWKVWPYSQYLR